MSEMIIIYDLLPEIAEKLGEAVDQAVRKAAFDTQAVAQSLAPVGPTGFLKNSIYVRTHDKSTYSNIQAPQAGQEQLPEAEQPKKGEAWIAVAANYGIFVEFGTVHMYARPFLTPAAEFVRPQFIHALEKMEDLMSAL